MLILLSIDAIVYIEIILQIRQNEFFMQREKDHESTAAGMQSAVVDVEMTQKIDFDYKEAFGDEDTQPDSISSEKLKPGSISNLFHKDFVFAKKLVPDDYVKSSSVACMISSIPALEKDVKLHDIHDNYVLKDKIAEGAQGVVWTGYDKSLKRDIIIKTAKSGDEEELNRDNNFFVSEARIMAQLDHPAIVPIYGMFSDSEDRLHLTMKHIHGRTMKDYLQGIIILYQQEGVNKYAEKYSILTRIEYLVRVCEAVDYAHCKGVIHRDLKPENIIIGSHGEIYVMDWGLACLLSPEEYPGSKHLTEIGLHLRCELAGTPCYIAPELIRGGLTSPQSDIFSLGMILFEIVTLTRAVPGTSIHEVFRNILKRNYNPFRHRFLRSKLSDDLKAIIAKATSPSLSRRYKSARDMARDLRNYLMHRETSARPYSLVRKFLHVVGVHATITASVILSILLGLTVIALYGLHSQNILINKQKKREAVLTHFQYEVTERSNRLNNALSYFEDQLANLGSHSKYIWDAGADTVDYVHALAYFSKTKPNDALLKSMSLEDKKKVILSEILKHVMVTSNLQFKHKMIRSGKVKSADHNKAIVGIFAGFPDNSILTCPAGRKYAKECYPAKRPSYKEALGKNNGMIWSKPFKCAVCRKIVICCIQRVSDKNNKTLGVVGLDIDLEYIQRYLFRNEIPGMQEFLIDKDGDIILSNSFRYKDTKINPETKTLIFKKFPFNKEFRAALERGELQFRVKRYTQEYIFGIDRIPSLGYYYIEQISGKNLREHHRGHRH